jgi:hypothetical protein
MTFCQDSSKVFLQSSFAFESDIQFCITMHQGWYRHMHGAKTTSLSGNGVLQSAQGTHWKIGTWTSWELSVRDFLGCNIRVRWLLPFNCSTIFLFLSSIGMKVSISACNSLSLSSLHQLAAYQIGVFLVGPLPILAGIWAHSTLLLPPSLCNVLVNPIQIMSLPLPGISEQTLNCILPCPSQASSVQFFAQLMPFLRFQTHPLVLYPLALPMSYVPAGVYLLQFGTLYPLLGIPVGVYPESLIRMSYLPSRFWSEW